MSQVAEFEQATTALVAAVRNDDVEAVEAFLTAGGNPDVQDEHGCTALHIAVAGAHIEAAACLLSYGADHRIADSIDWSAIGTISFNGPDPFEHIKSVQKKWLLPSRRRFPNWIETLPFPDHWLV